MRITTDYNNYNSRNTNFKSFSISYGAEEKLYKLKKQLPTIYDIGRKCEYTHFYDLEMLSNLTFRIKEKGCKFGMLAEPITVIKPKDQSPKLAIKGKYDGLSTDKHRHGDDYYKYIEYSSPEEALKGYDRIMAATDYITKIYYVLRELEEEARWKEANEIKKLTLPNNLPLDNVLMKRYGDFVKEYK